MDSAKIREVLGDAICLDTGELRAPSGDLGQDISVLNWSPGQSHVAIEGNLTADELEAIAAHMRAHGGK